MSISRITRRHKTKSRFVGVYWVNRARNLFEMDAWKLAHSGRRHRIKLTNSRQLINMNYCSHRRHSYAIQRMHGPSEYEFWQSEELFRNRPHYSAATIRLNWMESRVFHFPRLVDTASQTPARPPAALPSTTTDDYVDGGDADDDDNDDEQPTQRLRQRRHSWFWLPLTRLLGRAGFRCEDEVTTLYVEGNSILRGG